MHNAGEGLRAATILNRHHIFKRAARDGDGAVGESARIGGILCHQRMRQHAGDLVNESILQQLRDERHPFWRGQGLGEGDAGGKTQRVPPPALEDGVG